jgi:hypothetical protein
LVRIGLSICPNRSSQHGHNFGSQYFAIKGRLSPWICIVRSCCSGLREYLGLSWSHG